MLSPPNAYKAAHMEFSTTLNQVLMAEPHAKVLSPASRSRATNIRVKASKPLECEVTTDAIIDKFPEVCSICTKPFVRRRRVHRVSLVGSNAKEYSGHSTLRHHWLVVVGKSTQYVAEEMLLSEMGPRPRDESTCAERLANLLRSGPAVGPTCRIGWMRVVQHDVQYLRRVRLSYTGSCHPDGRRIKS